MTCTFFNAKYVKKKKKILVILLRVKLWSIQFSTVLFVELFTNILVNINQLFRKGPSPKRDIRSTQLNK